MYLKRLGERISKISKPHKLLSVLHLIDRIYQCNPRLTYPNVVVNQMDALPKKEGIILENAINYYHYFLLAPSIPFFQDGTRLFPDHGQEHFQMIINLLNVYNKSYTIIYDPDITARVNIIKKSLHS